MSCTFGLYLAAVRSGLTEPFGLAQNKTTVLALPLGRAERQRPWRNGVISA